MYMFVAEMGVAKLNSQSHSQTELLQVQDDQGIPDNQRWLEMRQIEPILVIFRCSRPKIQVLNCECHV